jgi:chemotaxis protein MotB
MKHSNTRSHRSRSAALILLLAAIPFAACVTRGKHDRIVGSLEQERGDLQARIRDLERSNRSLSDERAALLDSMEDIRQERERLTIDVAKLQKTKDLLSEHLRKREEEVEELSKLKSTYRGLVAELESEVTAGQIQIEQLAEGIRVNLSQEILFRSGAVELETHGVGVLRKVAGQLAGTTHVIEVQGHSDNVPLSTSLARRWGTNWELAAARASSVVRVLQGEGVDPTRLTAVSFGEFAPVADNDTPEGRAHNRRIEIRLKPVETPALAGENPRAGAPAAAGSPPAAGS